MMGCRKTDLLDSWNLSISRLRIVYVADLMNTCQGWCCRFAAGIRRCTTSGSSSGTEIVCLVMTISGSSTSMISIGIVRDLLCHNSRVEKEKSLKSTRRGSKVSVYTRTASIEVDNGEWWRITFGTRSFSPRDVKFSIIQSKSYIIRGNNLLVCS